MLKSQPSLLIAQSFAYTKKKDTSFERESRCVSIVLDTSTEASALLEGIDQVLLPIEDMNAFIEELLKRH